MEYSPRLNLRLPEEDDEVVREDFVSNWNDIDQKVATKEELNILSTQLANYSSFASNPDAKGVFLQVDYKRSDGTLYMRSVLSNPDTNGNYQTNTWSFYDASGTTVVKVTTWTLTFNASNQIVSKVVS